MAKKVTVTLGRTYTWREADGEEEQFYGPGEVEVPTALAEVLQRIGAVEEATGKAKDKKPEVDNGAQSNTE